MEASRSLGLNQLAHHGSRDPAERGGPLIVYTTLIIPSNILFEGGLSFLGVGVPDDPSSDAQPVRQRVPIRGLAHDLPGHRAVHDHPGVQPGG